MTRDIFLPLQALCRPKWSKRKWISCQSRNQSRVKIPGFWTGFSWSSALIWGIACFATEIETLTLLSCQHLGSKSFKTRVVIEFDRETEDEITFLRRTKRGIVMISKHSVHLSFSGHFLLSLVQPPTAVTWELKKKIELKRCFRLKLSFLQFIKSREQSDVVSVFLLFGYATEKSEWDSVPNNPQRMRSDLLWPYIFAMLRLWKIRFGFPKKKYALSTL